MPGKQIQNKKFSNTIIIIIYSNFIIVMIVFKYNNIFKNYYNNLFEQNVLK